MIFTVMFVHMFAGNVLLLRNHVNLSTDITEISSSKLLGLIATRLLDTNEVKDGVTLSRFCTQFCL